MFQCVKIIAMTQDKRTIIIFSKYRRLTRLWQFFFTGWGLIMIASLVAGALFTRQILWSPISAINMTDIVTNQFKMSHASFAGTDTNGEPFSVNAESGRQEYEHPDIVYLDKVSGSVVRITDGQKITDNIKSNRARYNRTERTLTLLGNVRINSSNGDKILTDEMVIKL